MTRLPKGWRGKTGVTGVYVKAKTLYEVERNMLGMWHGWIGSSGLTPLTVGYHKATDAMKAVDRLIEEQENDRSV